ncbi:MAG: hypothetical protein U9Q63_03505 [Patescibacteria group bacterium]|nr:hypothetical protein [Patescibacteria group bacterium]
MSFRGFRRRRRFGRMGGKFLAGPGGKCRCTNPDCDYKASHKIGIPCYKTRCVKCGSPMIRIN